MVPLGSQVWAPELPSVHEQELERPGVHASPATPEQVQASNSPSALQICAPLRPSLQSQVWERPGVQGAAGTEASHSQAPKPAPSAVQS